jgi:hypothetical protein
MGVKWLSLKADDAWDIRPVRRLTPRHSCLSVIVYRGDGRREVCESTLSILDKGNPLCPDITKSL